MYHLLPQSPESSSPVPKEEESEDREPDSPSRLPYASLCLCLLFTLVNIAVTVVSERTSPPTVPAPVTHKNIHLLRRPSQYIRFNEIQRPSPPLPRQFNNYPIALAQIDAVDAGKIFEEDPRAYMSPIGTVVPEDRRVSTIAQFRTIDWGMEDCELHLSLPTLNVSIASPPNVGVELYRLNQTYPLDLATLSYRSRPLRVAQVASIPLARGEGTLWHGRFGCPADSVLTFELSLACPRATAGECTLEWWQKVGYTEPHPGE
ncbi:hypothetical protein FB451DRAFT_1028782 [Mycena latifolia]|nr:hypothetical protein FB451DRAFT_1028782 [Mycena latifolia]